MTGMRPDDAIAKARFVRGVQAIGLFVLVAVVALRPLVSESYDSAGNSITRAVESLADPSPARTLGFDLIILAASCVWLFSFALDRAAKYRWTGLEIGLVILAIAGGVSCFFAGNKRLAINGTVDWLCLPILTITLVQLLRTQWQRRLMLAAILATASVNVTQCFEQYFVGFAETIEHYEAGKEEFWARQGVELDSTTVDAFERRLRAREASGFFAHSNVAGAYLMLCAFAAAGVIASSLAPVGPRNVATGGVRRGGRNPWKAVSLKKPTPDGVEGTQNEGTPRSPFSAIARFASLIFALATAGAVFLTGSFGALVSGAVGVVMLLLAWWKRDWIANHRRRVFWISWIVIIVGVASVIGHGLYHDSLPGWSLTFRWQYWKASASMIADNFWTGVGRENFGRHYTLYKDIASPEEVSNPHNFFVHAAAEWGIVGLIAVLAMIVGVTLRTARSSVQDTLPTEAEDNPRERNFVAWLVGVGLVIVLGRALLLGSDDADYIYYAAVTTGIIWFPAFAGYVWAAPPPTGNRPCALGFALAAGLFAFLLQDTISFALFVPASATTFFALLAVWMSGLPRERTKERARSQSPRRWLFVAASTGLTAASWIDVFLPVSRANGWLAEAKARQMRSEIDYPIEEALRASAGADRLDPTPWVEKARWLTGRANEQSLQRALESLAQAIVRDPGSISLPRRKSQLHLALARQTRKPDDYMAAVETEKEALALYPADPAGLVSLGDAELIAGRALQSKELLLAAKQHYEDALALDEERLQWETIQRFRRRVVDEIHAKIRSVEVLLADTK